MCSLWVCWYEVCVYDVRATMHTCSGRWLCLFKSNRNDGLGKIHIHRRRWHFIGVRYCFIDIGHVLNTCGTGFIHSLFFSSETNDWHERQTHGENEGERGPHHTSDYDFCPSQKMIKTSLIDFRKICLIWRHHNVHQASKARKSPMGIAFSNLLITW